eukprot:gnl/TRDRNA2_/TRDRNA2_177924_c0_seq6.p1 gnl/TRDRNA2_/TRDRNA2_177924_c0~~gnl/TRDRNA2_/TRDRNA2_177924_c0_seq6.p1  ORF type:complete len:178 (+),score=5.93 gnl/TRDRNA2_/TRDRNA2_177924_c0_seq6:123-656(+)
MNFLNKCAVAFQWSVFTSFFASQISGADGACEAMHATVDGKTNPPTRALQKDRRPKTLEGGFLFTVYGIFEDPAAKRTWRPDEVMPTSHFAFTRRAKSCSDRDIEVRCCCRPQPSSKDGEHRSLRGQALARSALNRPLRKLGCSGTKKQAVHHCTVHTVKAAGQKLLTHFLQCTAAP